jgi:hypothetical protein
MRQALVGILVKHLHLLQWPEDDCKYAFLE